MSFRPCARWEKKKSTPSWMSLTLTVWGGWVGGWVGVGWGRWGGG
jgi:hypothetical protein